MKTYIFIFFFLISNLVFSQRKITGTVTDSNNNPIEDVLISVKSENISTYTGKNGEFSIVLNNIISPVKFSKTNFREQLIEIKEDTIKIVMLKISEIDIYDLTLSELMVMNVVSSTQTDQSLSEAPSVISAVQKDDITKIGVISIIDILNMIPGIETSIGINGDYRISIRGIRRDGNLLFLIDGQDISDFYDGKSIYDFPVDFIERIEVIRGPGSAMYGTNALAGVINIITKKESTSISLSGGTNSTYSGNFNLNTKKNNVALSLLGGYVHTNGANVQPRTLDPESTELLEGTTNRWLQDVYLKSNLEIRKLSISVFGIHRNRGAWVGPLYFLTQDSDIKDDQLFGNISYSADITKKLNFQPKIYGSLINHDYLLNEYPAGRPDSSFIDGTFTNEIYTSLKVGTDLKLDYTFNKNFDLTSGVTFENMQLLNYDLLKNYHIIGPEYMDELGHYDDIELVQQNKERTIFAIYLQLLYDWNNFGITAGLRYDSYNDFGNSFNPRLGFVYRFTDLKQSFFQPFNNINIKLLYGKAFRAPTFKELYDKTNIHDGISGVRGNADLTAGTVNTSELAFEFEHKIFILKTNIYYNSNENIIGVYDEVGTGTPGIYENLGNINGKGIEIEANIKFSRKIIFYVNASKFINKFSWNDDPEYTNHNIYMLDNGDNIMHNIPMFRANTGLNVILDKFTFYASLNYGGKSASNKRYLIENRFVKIPQYLLGNFNITYNINSKFILSLSGNNIGEIKYSDPEESTNIRLLGKYGMGQPGSTFLLKLCYQF